MEPRPSHGFVYGRRDTRPRESSYGKPIRRLSYVEKGLRKDYDMQKVI